MTVFLLWHVHDELDDDAKLLGVFSSRETAEAQIGRALPLPGFRDDPDGFVIDEYTLDRAHWTEGYVTV
jgi:homoserine kinase type II